MLHISIKPEVIFTLAGFPVTNSIFASWILIALFLLLALYFKKNVDSKDSKAIFFIRFILTKMSDFFKPIIGSVGDDAFPAIASIFFFVLFANWMGLLPGFGSIVVKAPEASHAIEKEIHVEEVELEEVVIDSHGEEIALVADDIHDTGTAAESTHEESEEEHGPVATPLLRGSTADLNMTFALALVSFFMIQYFGIRELRLEFFKKFIDLSSPINFFIGILEIVSEISKVISFAFRLFGNIFAGEVLLVVVAFLIPVLASFPFLILEVFVGVIQALVFAMLTAVFINLSTTAHH